MRCPVVVRLRTPAEIAAAEEALATALLVPVNTVRLAHGMPPDDPRLSPPFPEFRDRRTLEVYTRPWVADLLWRLEHLGRTRLRPAGVRVARRLRASVRRRT